MAIGDVTPKKLFQGPLSSAVTAVYTVPAGCRAHIVDVLVVNHNVTTDRKFNMYAHGTAAGNQIHRNVLAVKNSSAGMVDNKIILAAGEALAMSQDAGTDLIVTIYGYEEVIA